MSSRTENKRGTARAAVRQTPARKSTAPYNAQMMDDLGTYLREYARERPEAAALICLGMGFILGWKLKPW